MDESIRVLGGAWPADVRVVVLLVDPGSASWAPAAAEELAAELGRHRRPALLVNLSPTDRGLDERFGATDGPGLTAALEGEASVAEVARRVRNLPFAYLPAGEEPAPPARLLASTGLATLVGRVREAGGVLLLYTPATAFPGDVLPGWIEGRVSMGPGREAALPWAGVPEVGRLRDREAPAETAGVDWSGAPTPPPVRGAAGRAGPDGSPPYAPADVEVVAGDEVHVSRRKAADADAAGTDAAAERSAVDAASVDSGESAGRDAPGADVRAEDPSSGAAMSRWRRHRTSPEFPVIRVAAGAAAILVLVMGWWVLAARVTPDASGGTPREPAAAAGAVDTGAASGGTEDRPSRTPTSTGAARGTAGEEETTAGPEFAESGTSSGPEEATSPGPAVALPYSVLVASHPSLRLAMGQLDRLRGDTLPGPTYFAAPTPVSGRTYYRVFAGAVPDTAAAAALMRALVEAGVKERVHGWDMRPVALSFLVDTVESREAALRRRDELESRGVPAYLLPAGGGPEWRVYAGAYRNEREAAVLRERLRELGVEAELVRRTGAGESTP